MSDIGSTTTSDLPGQDVHDADINITQLLSTCIDAARRGCEVIRNVRHKSLHSTEILDSVLYKIADDPRSALTEADGASQKVIIECITQIYEKEIDAGRIKIVGEEEDDHSTDLECDESFDTQYSECMNTHFDNYNCPRPDVEPIVKDMFNEEQKEGDIQVRGVKGDEIIIFIDPMDGTREFVEGRIQNVQCLIGITVNGIPVAGAMGIPMMHENQIEIAYGLIKSKKSEDCGEEEVVPVLSGVKYFGSINPLDPSDKKSSSDEKGDDCDVDSTLMVYSGDSKKPALSLAMDCLENRVLKSDEAENDEGCNMNPPIQKIVAGGCGNKMLSVQRHYECISKRRAAHEEGSLPPQMVGSLSIAPPGSSSWDTAAPTAVLLAADPKARVTDLLGRPLIYDGDNLLNNCGIVVSSGYVASRIHTRLCEGLCDNEKLRDVLGTAPPTNNIDEIPTDICETR